MNNELLSFFPLDNKIKEIRPNQIIALNAIWTAIENNKKKITLCGSTGSGKSKIGETVIRYFESQDKRCLYTSPLNSLVDQIEDTKHSDSQIVTLKGKTHYSCIAKGNGTKCDEGYCSRKICYVTRNAPKEKRIKRNCKDCRLADCVCRGCIYKAVFRKYRHSEAGNTNASLWLMGIMPEDISVLIIDEVDSLEDFVRLQSKVIVPYHVQSDDFSHHIEIAEKYADSLESCLDCEQGYDCTPRNISRHESKINSIRNMANDFENNGESWVIRNELKGDSVRTVYEPVTVERFTEPLLEDLEFTLCMSATPPHWENYEFIEVPSPFPIDIRQCYYHSLGRMSKDHRDKNIPKLAEFITTLKGKTVVHCVSYPNAQKISMALKALGSYPLVQVNDNSENENEGTVARWDAVRAFKASKKPNEVLLSVNLNRGVDFWEPDIQNNIIPFVPFQNPTDLLVQAKDKVLPASWKDETTAITIEQSHGRNHRGIIYLADVVKERPDLAWLPVNAQGMVVKRTFITDSNFNNGRGRLAAWYQRNKRFFSQSFNEVMIMTLQNGGKEK